MAFVASQYQTFRRSLWAIGMTLELMGYNIMLDDIVLSLRGSCRLHSPLPEAFLTTVSIQVKKRCNVCHADKEGEELDGNHIRLWCERVGNSTYESR